jgi:Putative DNA-binding domain
MALLHLPLQQITAHDLQRLVSTGAPESVYIDYKSAMYGGAHADHREFLADISSFANTVGGDLVIGMTEVNGIPNGFNPFPVHPDAELRRLDDMARSGLEPRISNLKTQAVPAPIGGFVIIVRIPRSYSRPHRVIHSESNRFWARSSASAKKYQPNVDELRRIFSEAPVLAERIRAFRADRLIRIVDQDTLSFLAGRCLLILHVIPYSAFDLGSSQSLEQFERQWELFPPLGRTRGTHRHVNFDGFVVLSNQDHRPGSQKHSYAQVFRSGVIEAGSTMDGGDGILRATRIDQYCVRGTKIYVENLAKFGIGCPIVVLASLIGVKERTLESGIDNLYAPYGQLPIDQDQLNFTEAIIEILPADTNEYATVLHPLLEQVWNTAGFSSPRNRDRNGNYLFPI